MLGRQEQPERLVMKKFVLLIILCFWWSLQLFAPVKTTGSASNVSAQSTSTIKVASSSGVNLANTTVRVGANAKLEGVTNLTNSTINKNGGINTTIQSGVVTNAAAVSVTNSSINLSSSIITQPITVAGNSSLEGVPTTFSTSSNGISLAGPSTTLNIAVTSPIATNIALNGGTLNLQGTTKLADGKITTGNGTINCNSSSLVLGAAPVTISSAIKIKKGADLQFNGTVSLSGTLLFDENASICGNGNIFDISNGTIAIRPKTNLHLTNIVIRGMGTGKIIFYDTTSTMSLSNVQIVMNSNYSVTTGGMYVQGPTVITTGNNNLSFSLKGSMTVDGVSLLYDTLGYANNQNISPAPNNDPLRKNMILLNNGVVRGIVGGTNPVGTNIDGSSNVVVLNTHQVFRKVNPKISGCVRLGNGFTILSDASACFDTFITASGPIDLRETGTLILNSNLGLGANVTLSSGGGIYGYGNAVILNGNLILPTTKVLHIMSDTIIDGQGHTLTVGDYGQLVVDPNATLTLQNIVVKAGQKCTFTPPFKCAALSSKLVLDNVIIESQSDVPFSRGQLFINNDVIFTGTSSFIYMSPKTSFIAAGSTLLFDKTTTFSYAPASNSKDLILLQNPTSRIILDGATLKCTDTGLRLINGMLLCDNKVSLDSLSGLLLSSITSVTYGYYCSNYNPSAQKIRWHPSGDFFACVGDGGGAARVYKFNQNANIVAQAATLPFDTLYPYALDWSHDGRQLSIAGPTGSNVLVFSALNWGSFSLTLNAGSISFWPYALAWSLDGKFLAVAGSNLNIYRFNGVKLILVASVSYAVKYMAWHPTGNYLAVAGSGANEVKIYQFNNSTLGSSTTQAFTGPLCVDWSPDGNYLAVGGSGGVASIYSFNGSSLNSLTSSNFGASISSIKWNPDGKLLAVTGAAKFVQTYLFNGTSLASTSSYSITAPTEPTQLYDCAWHPSGQYLAIIGTDATGSAGGQQGKNEYFYILKMNCIAQTTQAITNSIVFGNATAGSNADLSVKILSGARVEVRGQVFDNSSNP